MGDLTNAIFRTARGILGILSNDTRLKAGTFACGCTGCVARRASQAWEEASKRLYVAARDEERAYQANLEAIRRSLAEIRQPGMAQALRARQEEVDRADAGRC